MDIPRHAGARCAVQLPGGDRCRMVIYTLAYHRGRDKILVATKEVGIR